MTVENLLIRFPTPHPHSYGSFQSSILEGTEKNQLQSSTGISGTTLAKPGTHYRYYRPLQTTTDHYGPLYCLWSGPGFADVLEYDFILKHIPCSTNTRADALSRRSNGSIGKNDNNNVIVLLTEVFINTTDASLSSINETCQQVQLISKDIILSWVDHHNL